MALSGSQLFRKEDMEEMLIHGSGRETREVMGVNMIKTNHIYIHENATVKHIIHNEYIQILKRRKRRRQREEERRENTLSKTFEH